MFHRLRLRPHTDQSISFLMFLSFLLTFLVSRITTYLAPELFLSINGVHIHHFAYGIVLLSLLGYVSLTRDISRHTRLRLSLLYGVALGLAFDEFAMWIQLEDVYYSRPTYDAIITISLVLLNAIYFGAFWKKWGSRLGKLLKILFWNVPYRAFRFLRHI